MTWLITGADGQLGKSVCEVLKKKSLAYIGWTRSTGEITSANLVSEILNQSKPKVLVNCAAWTDVDGAEINEQEVMKVNRDAVGILSKAAMESGIKFVHISTDYVFSGEKPTPWKLGDKRFPKTVYGKSKVFGEDIALKNFSEGTYIFRTAWLYSEYGNNFVKSIIRLALTSDAPIRVVNDQTGQPTSALDLANRIIDSMEAQIKPGLYHATNSGSSTWYEFAEEILTFLNFDVARLEPIRSSEINRAAIRPRNSVLDQDCWNTTTLKPMREWRLALQESLPIILEEVRGSL